MPAHVVVFQGMWVRAARERESVWEIGRVQLHVQRLAATRCESLLEHLEHLECVLQPLSPVRFAKKLRR